MKILRPDMATVVKAGFLTLSLSAVGLASTALAAPKVGAPAPGFTGTSATGEQVALSDLRGKTVVLEWTNHDCPYVRKHYRSGNMQALQKDATAGGVTWLSIISSAPGTQGHVSPEKASTLSTERGATPSHVLLDPDGTIGRTYAARTTPHMYVIDADGVLRFMGGIDDRPSSSVSDIEGATNYVRAALEDLGAGREVATPVARPYGCSVKYRS